MGWSGRHEADWSDAMTIALCFPIPDAEFCCSTIGGVGGNDG